MISEKILIELNKNFCNVDYMSKQLFNIELNEKIYQIENKKDIEIRKSLFYLIAKKRFEFLPKCIFFAMLYFFHQKCRFH